MVNQKYLDKAEVLIEALPYIQRFNRKIVVVKYGGSAMLDDELKKNVIKDVVLLKLVGFKPIIVHGGGKEISRWVGKVGMEPKFINGLRVTDKDTMEIAEMVLAKVNKELVTLVESLGVQAVGVSGKDGGLLQCRKKLSKGEDIGYVGDIEKVNPKVLQDLLERDFLPIVFPIGYDTNFDSYNINADDAACAIAEAVHAEKGEQAQLAGGPALHHPDRQGPGPRPQPGDYPPGYQAPQHDGAAGRQPEGGRFRHRPAHLRRPGHPDPGGPIADCAVFSAKPYTVLAVRINAM